MTEPDVSSQEERLRFFAQLEAFSPMVVVEAGQSLFVVETSDQTVARLLFVKGGRREFATMEKAVSVIRSAQPRPRPRGVFVDVGANIGTSAVTALRCHGFAGAVACEPEPRNYRLLKTNLALNDVLDRALTLPVAVSDSVGPLSLAVDSSNSGSHRVVTASGPLTEEAGFGRITVDAVTLDLLVDRMLIDPPGVELLWVDVQGHEAQVLRGGSTLLDAGTPVVLEFHPPLLRAGDGLAALQSLARESFTHFVDLRAHGSEPKPIKQLNPLADSLEALGSYTDIVLLRLTPSRAKTLRRRAAVADPSD